VAVYVQKFYNEKPSVVPDGVGVLVSSTGYHLYVVNAEGAKIALFRTPEVEKHWVESDRVSLPGHSNLQSAG
jgi:hypothetical protein